MKKQAILDQSESIATLFSALANERRVQIVANLLGGEQSVGVLATTVQLSQSALSQHLSKLRAQNLVKTRRDGQIIFYSMKDEGVGELLTSFLRIYRGDDNW